jgi:hypothetical protein
MAVKVHLAKRVEFARDCWRLNSLCRRLSNAGDDMNVTDDPAEVTCKFCLREMALLKKRGKKRKAA